jgi:hypothetical protein
VPNQFRRSSAKNNAFCLFAWIQSVVKFSKKAFSYKHQQSSKERPKDKKQREPARLEMASLKERFGSQDVGDKISRRNNYVKNGKHQQEASVFGDGMLVELLKMPKHWILTTTTRLICKEKILRL